MFILWGSFRSETSRLERAAATLTYPIYFTFPSLDSSLSSLTSFLLRHDLFSFHITDPDRYRPKASNGRVVVQCGHSPT